ncbi:MAG: type III pantothenate kinase [Gammaproteobacteria bacterium]|nr:type III pantothenate kinase [Gammaproteobacteria bacterium]
MNLLVDLGNSRLKWALAQGAAWRSGTFAYGARMASDLDRAWSDLGRPRRVVAASVGGAERAQVLASWVRDRWALAVDFLEPSRSQLGVINTYDEPSSLGADRWAALIAARKLFSGPACVVDCGTAVTLDALGADGTYLGGVILPGITLMRDCLCSGTAGIRCVDGRDDSCLARNTADAVAAGTVYGLAGAVTRIAEEFRQVLGPDMRVVLGGGAADPVVARLAGHLTPLVQERDLVLKGLALVAEASA